MAALSGIDQALWDIAGKYHETPVYKLLGGPVRERIRVYAHWGIPSLDDKAQDQLIEATLDFENCTDIAAYMQLLRSA